VSENKTDNVEVIERLTRIEEKISSFILLNDEQHKNIIQLSKSIEQHSNHEITKIVTELGDHQERIRNLEKSETTGTTKFNILWGALIFLGGIAVTVIVNFVMKYFGV